MQKTIIYDITHFSNYSLPDSLERAVHIAAPGVGILSTLSKVIDPDDELKRIQLNNDGVDVTRLDGTSQAAPHVAGTIALLASAFPKATTSQLKAAILYGANHEVCNDFTAYGMLDVMGAMSELKKMMCANSSSMLDDDEFDVTFIAQSEDESEMFKTQTLHFKLGEAAQPVKYKKSGSGCDVGNNGLLGMVILVLLGYLVPKSLLQDVRTRR